MVSRLNRKRMEVNMPIAETKDMDINALTDNELDDVNGGVSWLAAAVGYLAGAVLGHLKL